MRVAALADLHARAGHHADREAARIRALVERVSREADVLVLAGDLTDHGRAVEAETLLEGLRAVDVPIVAVLGNHDHEDGSAPDLVRMLQTAGVHCLDRGNVTLDGVGFAGAKGFCGGFEPRIVRGFGEDSIKAFVSESLVEAEALRAALRALEPRTRVAVTHYAPVVDTVQGEPPEIFPFLGTSRLAAAIDDGGAAVAFHGHAHHGAPHGRTPGGVPVWNVSLPVLQQAKHPTPYRVVEVPEEPAGGASGRG